METKRFLIIWNHHNSINVWDLDLDYLSPPVRRTAIKSILL